MSCSTSATCSSLASTTTCDGSTTPYDDATYFVNYFAYPWSTCNWAENWLVANDTSYYLQLTIPNWQHFSLPPGEGGLAVREPLAPDSPSTCREQSMSATFEDFFGS